VPEPTHDKTVIDIAVPVLNEERSLERNVRALARFLGTRCPHDWLITVVDNGSDDATWALATAMAESVPRVRAVRLDRRGRGAALKAAWSSSDADVLAYMDVDLSTDLEALPRLVEPVIAGLADISVGSRLAKGSRVQRSLRREVVSRAYNLIARAALGYGVRDAQCGFKALSREVAQKLVPEVADDGWFFDTELLALAHHHGFTIKEVAVSWVEDTDSRVRIAKTAVEDLRGLWRLRRDGAHNRDGAGDPSRPAAQLEGVAARAQARWEPKEPAEAGPAEFDSYALHYERAVDQAISFTGRGSDFFAQRKAELLEALSRRHLGDLSRLRVLDVGCGTGTLCRHLAGRAGQLHGADISKQMLDIARASVEGAEFHWYDGEVLPFEDASFDVVVTVCALHHVPTPRRAHFVAELHRVARTGGLVAVFEHNPFNPLTRWAVRSCDMDKGVVLVRGRQAAALLTSAGASVLGRTNFLFTPLGGQLGSKLDRALAWLPLGGQYVVTARAEHASPSPASQPGTRRAVAAGQPGT